MALTLGLAPFSPEPHILGKIRWIAGGANGMAAIDWFDFFIHAAPWIWLIIALIIWLNDLPKKRDPEADQSQSGDPV